MIYFKSLKNSATHVYNWSLFSAFQEDTKKKVTEEEEKFIKEITDFNDEYEITKKRDIVRQENIKKEISDLEKQANVLRGGTGTGSSVTVVNEYVVSFACLFTCRFVRQGFTV